MNVVVVLHNPQDLVNIAVVIRAMRNFGAKHLRLVAPQSFDPFRVEGIAHNSGDVVARTEIFETLDEALADRTLVAGLTARGRTVKRNVVLPGDAAVELRGLEASERVAILLGPEDRGLTNDELDRCHRIVTIPTRPESASLNLAQAATVMLYELFKVEGAQPFKRPRRHAPSATREQLEQLFADVERALAAIEFFKSHTSTSIMRTVREIVHRAPLDARETRLLQAVSREVVNFLDRKGVGTT